MRTYKKYEPPKTIEEARGFAQLRASMIASLWGWRPSYLARFLNTYKPKGAVKRGRDWFVTPELMDRLGDQKFFDSLKKQSKKNLSL